MAVIIDGKALAQTIRTRLKEEVGQLKARHSQAPGLATVLVGEDPASAVYVRNKVKACQEVGLNTFDHKLAVNISEPELISLLENLSSDNRVHGILLQLPLPSQISTAKALRAIKTEKDVDGFGVDNLGR